MEKQKNNGLSSNEHENKFIKNGISDSDEEEKQVVCRLFSLEITAPKGVKNPRIIYIGFIIINIFILVFLKKTIIG